MTNLQRLNKHINNAFIKGGLTLQTGLNNFLNEVTYKGGYQVGGFSKVIKLKISQYLEELRHDNGATLYYEVIGLIPEQSGYNIGLWFNEAAGVLEIEVSKRFTSKKAALKEAAEREQLAIYNWKKQETIYL